ncbi:hypothetical protein FH972_021503 [Carpinus fangiana]|uniref:Uncharacterized protein n=1 Tax=Carpinus fangiana TaxID=176857 RepID=A0A5N6KPJ8_9ROSI|nr:hypothetical protein FH972_021503 [Carpinus fangiana]
MPSEYTYRLVPGRSLGPPVLGSYLHDVLRRLKHPQLASQYPAVDLAYSHSGPAIAPIVITLARNGLRLRFDGPEQRLRLIEVLDFRKTSVEYEGSEIFKAHEADQLGPSYRSLTKLFGPTFPGEYLEDPQSQSSAIYVLSYPGIAFSFSVSRSGLDSRKDNHALLSSSAASPAKSMAIFVGESFSKARTDLFSPTDKPLRQRAASSGRHSDATDDVDLVKVYGEGRLELIRRSGQPLVITLSETTPQDLVTELGPPDAIYRKNDRRLAIHRNRGHARGRSSSADTDYSSSRTTEDDSEDEDPENPALSTEATELASAEHFYNYSRYGFDFLISQATTASAASPTLPEAMTNLGSGNGHDTPRGEQTATKMIMHGNVPASWLFGRHRRCRWVLEHVPTARVTSPLTSETSFADVAARLSEVFTGVDLTGSGSGQQKGMLLNRDWADSPSSSCELLGGWEEDTAGRTTGTLSSSHSQKDAGISSNSELFGYPGMIFEREVRLTGASERARLALLFSDSRRPTAWKETSTNLQFFDRSSLRRAARLRFASLSHWLRRRPPANDGGKSACIPFRLAAATVRPVAPDRDGLILACRTDALPNVWKRPLLRPSGNPRQHLPTMTFWESPSVALQAVLVSIALSSSSQSSSSPTTTTQRLQVAIQYICFNIIVVIMPGSKPSISYGSVVYDTRPEDSEVYKRSRVLQRDPVQITHGRSIRPSTPCHALARGTPHIIQRDPCATSTGRNTTPHTSDCRPVIRMCEFDAVQMPLVGERTCNAASRARLWTPQARRVVIITPCNHLLSCPCVTTNGGYSFHWLPMPFATQCCTLRGTIGKCIRVRCLWLAPTMRDAEDCFAGIDYMPFNTSIRTQNSRRAAWSIRGSPDHIPVALAWDLGGPAPPPPPPRYLGVGASLRPAGQPVASAQLLFCFFALHREISGSCIAQANIPCNGEGGPDSTTWSEAWVCTTYRVDMGESWVGRSACTGMHWASALLLFPISEAGPRWSPSWPRTAVNSVIGGQRLREGLRRSQVVKAAEGVLWLLCL